MITYKYFLTDPEKEEGGVALRLCTRYGAILSVEERELTRKHNNDLVHGYTAYLMLVGDSRAGMRDDGWPIAWSNTYSDYGLVITNNDVVGTPKVDTYYVLPPGSSSVIDLSEYITGAPHYQQRTLTFNFTYEMEGDTYLEFFSDFLYQFHGKRIRIVLDNDPSWCYEGRAIVGDIQRKLSICSFTMTVDCDPYKYEHNIETHTINKANTHL